MEDTKEKKKLDALWQMILADLEVKLSRANFTTWFKETCVLGIKDKTLIISVPNNFTREWLNKKYETEIIKEFRKNLYPKSVDSVKYNVDSSKPNLLRKAVNLFSPKPSQASLISNTFNLRPHYKFENFIVGNSNRLAHATSQAIAKKPGELYNPLFIYGGVGLGKTHLIQAIGNEVAQNDQNKKVIYVPCEKFTSEFVQSISSGNIDKFKDKYRNCDVLLVDDIQFLSKKEGIQEEFFHTFNTLHQSNRQIVLTSDRVPHAIPAIADRLSSRFGSGMVADIKSPDLEMRIAIIQTKCREKNYPLEQDSIEYIAQNISSNIRELEGILIQIATQCQVSNLPFSLKTIKRLLRDMPTKSAEKSISGKSILKIVSDFFNVDPKDLIGRKRTRDLVYPRQLVMYLMRHEINYSFPKIGQELGGKDHSTIMHGCKKIEKGSSRNIETQRHLLQIKEQLYELS